MTTFLPNHPNATYENTSLRSTCGNYEKIELASDPWADDVFCCAICASKFWYIFVIWFHDFPTFWAHSKSCIYVPLVWNIWDVDWMLWTLHIAPQRRPPRPGPWRGQHKAERAHCLPRQRTDRYTLTRKHVEFHRMKGWIGASAFLIHVAKHKPQMMVRENPQGINNFKDSDHDVFSLLTNMYTCACELVIKFESFIYWKMGSVQSSQQPHLSTQPCGIRTLESFARWSRRGATLVQKEARCPMIPDYIKALKRIVLSKEDDLQFIETSKHYPSYSLFQMSNCFPPCMISARNTSKGQPQLKSRAAAVALKATGFSFHPAIPPRPCRHVILWRQSKKRPFEAVQKAAGWHGMIWTTLRQDMNCSRDRDLHSKNNQRNALQLPSPCSSMIEQTTTQHLWTHGK